MTSSATTGALHPFEASVAGRQRRRLASVVLAASLVGAPLAAAHAATDDGLWYYRDTGVAEAHQTATGEGITVAVIDFPINPDVPELADADLAVREEAYCDADLDGSPDAARSTRTEAEHGTAMTSLIVGNGQGVDGQPGVRGVAPGARLLYYALRGENESAACQDGGQGAAAAIDQAVADGAQIINLSLGGNNAHDLELDAIARAIRAGAIVVTAGGNEAGPIHEWPAQANGAVTVASLDAERELPEEYTIYGPTLDVAAPGEGLRSLGADGWQSYDRSSGTSIAAAWTSGALALVWSAHPEATGSQMIQTLLRHTTTGEGELSRIDDYWGYGIVSIRRMLESDPTTYPDVNPLIIDTADARPAYTELVDQAPATGAPETDETADGERTNQDEPVASDDTADSAAAPLVPVLIGVVTLAAVAAAVVGLILSRRRGGTPDHDNHSHDPQEH